MGTRMDDITTLLWCTDSDLKNFRKKVSNADERLTDQDLTNIVENLLRREHALEARLQKALTINSEYLMPKEWTEAIKKQIDFFQNDTTIRARVDAIGSNEAAFWGVLNRINEVLIKPAESLTRSSRIRFETYKADTGEDDNLDNLEVL